MENSIQTPVPVEKPQIKEPEVNMNMAEDLAVKLKKLTTIKDSDVMLLSQLLVAELKDKSIDDIVKMFADKSIGSYMGTTSKAGEEKHTHSFVIMSINFGDYIVGVTTSTVGDNEHTHTIRIKIDPKIIALDAYTNYPKMIPDKDNEGTSYDMHRHTFSVDLEEIKDEIDDVYISSPYSFKEKKEDVLFSNEREAELLILKASQTEIIASGDIEDYQTKIYNAVENKYPNLTIFDDSYVAEMIINLATKGKIDPKAKVRNKPNPVFPAGSSDVTDNKDYFPLGNINQARNALARASQYKTKPIWYKGTLEQLKKKVRSAVKKAYPSINVTGLNEFYALRFKDSGSAYFMGLITQSIDSAKSDASIYAKYCKKTDVDVIKFGCDDEGSYSFTDFGRIVLYDKDAKGVFSTYGDIQLSESDRDGNVMIEILREGKFNHEIYGEFEVTTDIMSKIIKNFNDNIIDRELSFDFNHMPELPAAAWVKKLSMAKRNIKGTMRSVLMAHVRFTKIGEEAVKNEEFKYFSAEYTDNFRDKENGRSFGTTLKGGGLTNRPWMPGLAPITLAEIEKNVYFANRN